MSKRQEFMELTGLSIESCITYQFDKMVQDEANHVKLRGQTRREEAAADRILNWIKTAKEYHFLDTKDLASLRDFVGSHRRACVWGVLLGLELSTD